MPTTIRAQPLTSCIGAVVPNVQLSSVDPTDAATIRGALHEHGVLVFPHQKLEPRTAGRVHASAR